MTREYHQRKANQHYEMAGLATRDRDLKDAERHLKEAKRHDQLARETNDA